MSTDFAAKYRELLAGMEIAPEHPPTPSTPEALDAYEIADGLKLPKSYREFAIVFGPGF